MHIMIYTVENMEYRIEFTRCLTSVIEPLVFLFCLSSVNIAGSSVCKASLPTIRDVEKCPITADDWVFAAKKKHCDEIASSQKCVPDSDKFVYHCLVNKNRMGFVEVCAPIWILTGFCGFYDTDAGRIYNDVNKDCTKFDESPCPKRFNSSDIYKYTGCFDITEEDKKVQSFTSSEQHLPSLISSEQHLPWLISNTVIAVISLITSVIILLVAIAFLYQRSRKKNVQRQNDPERRDSTTPLTTNVQSQSDVSKTPVKTNASEDVQTDPASELDSFLSNDRDNPGERSDSLRTLASGSNNLKRTVEEEGEREESGSTSSAAYSLANPQRKYRRRKRRR
uniref:Uncharacterized protein LOC111102397 isoform X2 n=1 Tax=Crassostrea virginica TaxID=6565 RepID=A0A8B8AHP3_CRAVI|nr:uncharacterized protein LOC111102397 isoform X2 [Crassostrea virginica]